MYMEVNVTGPQILEQFIGQPQVVGPVKVALESSCCGGEELPHMLLCGPPGTGKTELAQIVAKERGVRLREALGQTLRTSGAMAGFLLAAKEGAVLFIDEAHELSCAAQIQLCRAMSDGNVFLAGAKFGSSGSCMRVPPLTMLAATTDEFRLSKPLRDRFDLHLQFRFYANCEIAQIVRNRINLLGWQSDPLIPELIAMRSKGVPRIALRLLKGCRRLAQSLGDPVLKCEHFQRTCALERIDSLGLDSTEQEYLRLLSDAAGPVKATVLAAKMDLPLQTLQRVTENFLVRHGLIERGAKGRTLTAQGVAHLSRCDAEQE